MSKLLITKNFIQLFDENGSRLAKVDFEDSFSLKYDVSQPQIKYNSRTEQREEVLNQNLRGGKVSFTAKGYDVLCFRNTIQKTSNAILLFDEQLKIADELINSELFFYDMQIDEFILEKNNPTTATIYFNF